MAGVVSQADRRVAGATSIFSAVAEYGLAVASVAVALGVSLAIRWVATSPTNFAFYVAIFVSTWFLGRGPGWLATVVCIIASIALRHLLAGSGSEFAVTPADGATLIAMLLCAAAADVMSTRRYRTEAALRGTRDRLELTVQERTADLKKANEELRDEIAERKRAEAALRASEEWWRTIFESSNVPIGITDLSGRNVRVNAATERLLGYSNEELRTISIADLTHEEDRASTMPLFNELARGERKGYHVIKRYRCKDGSAKWLNATVSRVRDPQGGADLAVAIVADITEQKRAEQALRASEERWRRVFESSAVPMALADGSRRIIAVNPACERLLGYTPGEFLAMSALDFKHGDDRAVSARMLDDLEAGRRSGFQAEMRFRRKNGAVIWVNASVSYVPPTEITPALFPAVMEDITQRKQAEFEREQLVSIVECAGDMMAICELDGTPIYINEGGLRLVGLDTMDRLKGRRGSHFLFREDRPFVAEVVWPAIMRDGTWSGELRLRNFTTGEAIPVLYEGFRIDDPQTGQPVNIGEVCRDITERRRGENALQQARAELARVARITTMGELAASIAHEINQPLAAIVGSGAACQRWLANDPPELERARESAGRVLSEANRASEVIGRVRSLMSNKEPDRSMLALSEVVREVLSLLRTELQSKHVTVQALLAPDLPQVAADRVQVEQVILNLVMNAIEAMSAVADRARVLVVRSQALDGDMVQIAIEDCGTGLDRENAERIFDRFFTTKSGGMGMGLAISRTIIEAHGGRLWATPAPEHGTIFYITLPIEGGRTE